MYFTQDDYRRIEEWLRTRTVKDTEFQKADPLTGFEQVPIIQDGKNKIVDLDTFIRQLSLMELPDFLNVTTFTKKGNLFLEEAINAIPVEQRKLGLTITFHSEKGNWMIYQFKGTSLNQWSSLNFWSSIVAEAIEEFVYHPDEEDITGVRDGNRTFLKFKDKDYDPAEFSGMGRIMLRKNLVGTAACSLDDEDHLMNVLTQDMIREENTVYIVQYDFDLDGKVISIPKGCTLWFQGGSINNGTIYLQETAILGAFEFADIGNAKLFGKFNTGQVMTFSDDSYEAKEGGYFIPSTRPSSATPEEDAKQDKETFYDKNPEAYVTKTRQELRWWNGEQWVLILDITDYDELKAIINDLIDKHNAEMSACYKYFKARCYALELRMDEAERRIENHETRITKVEGDIVTINNEITNIHNDITNIEGDITTINNNITNIEGDISSIEQNVTNVTNNISDITNNIEEILQNITNLGDTINNIDQTIENRIEQYITNNIVGATSITVNGTTYKPDADGNIVLPDYPEGGSGGTAEKVQGKLKFTGASTATYDGSSDVTVNIPEGGSGGGGQADSVKGTLTIKTAGGTTLASYNGSTDKTVTLPEGGGGGGYTIITAKETLTVKQGDTTLGTYDGTEPKTISIPEVTPTAEKVNHKLKFTGVANATYDGSKDVTINIPTGSGTVVVPADIEPLTFKGAVNEVFDGKEAKEITIPSPTTLADLDTKPLVVKNAEGEEVISYNAKEEKELQLRKLHVKTNLNDTKGNLPSGVSDTSYSGSLIPYDIDLLKDDGIIDLTKVNFGTDEHPIVLYAAKIIRSNNKSAWRADLTYKHPFLSATVKKDDCAVVIELNSAQNNNYMGIAAAVASFSRSTAKDTDSNTGGGRYRSNVVGLRCAHTSNKVYVQGTRTADKNNDSMDFDPAHDGGSLLGFEVVIFGYINR